MIAILLVLLCAGTVWAQAIDPQFLGHAGAHDLREKDASALNWNPAVLGPDRGFRMSFELPSATVAFGNNAFSVKFWNDHLGGDHEFTDEEKGAILDRIPNDGLRANGEIGVPVLGFTYNRFGARASVQSYENAVLPKDLARLALMGNEKNSLYEFGKFAGATETLLDVAMGFGYRFDQEQIPDLHFGAGFHFYQGVYLASVIQSDGDLLITDSTIIGSSVVRTIRSNKGDGVGFDLSALATLSDQWEVGLAVTQIGARISWAIDQNNVVAFYTDSTGVIVDSLIHEDYKERAFHYQDIEYSGGSYESRLPTIVQANAVYRATPKWTLLGDATIRTESSTHGEAGLQVATSAEYLATRALPLYGGVSVGGPLGWRFGLGGGLRFRNYEMDLGWTWNGGILNSAHGIGFGLSQRLKF